MAFDRVKFEQFRISSGEKYNEGTCSLTVNTRRLIGPGVNNALICRLKKGEKVEMEFPELDCRSVFTPMQSAW